MLESFSSVIEAHKMHEGECGYRYSSDVGKCNADTWKTMRAEIQ